MNKKTAQLIETGDIVRWSCLVSDETFYLVTKINPIIKGDPPRTKLSFVGWSLKTHELEECRITGSPNGNIQWWHLVSKI